MSEPCLAAITLDPRGGGVALVARLVQAAFERQWGHCHVVTLLGDEGTSASMQPGLSDRMGFGVRLATHQAMGECDWVFYSHPSLARVQQFIPRAFRRPYVIFAHGVEAWRQLTSDELALYRGAAACLTNSEYTAARVAEANPDLPPLMPCHLALVPHEWKSAVGEARAPQKSGGPTVLTVGRMMADERYKGHDQLIDVWPAIRRRLPNARLVLVGEGDDARRLKGRGDEVGADAVSFEGFVSAERLRRLYEEADVFAMPSRGEGFGLVYLEAMAHRLPCVGSVHDAAGEIVLDGVSGFLVDQADTDQLADRLLTLLTDEIRRAEFGDAGYERLQSTFSFERFAERLTRALDPVLRARAGGADVARSA